MYDFSGYETSEINNAIELIIQLERIIGAGIIDPELWTELCSEKGKRWREKK